jgi:uncharacterized membrane protein YedE/YeeE
MKRAFLAALLLLFLPALAWAESGGTDPKAYPGPAWSPYLVGALIGVLVLLTLTFAGKPVGASSAYASVAGLVGQFVAPRLTGSLKYYREHKPGLNYTVLFLLGAVGGAFLAAWTGGELTGRWLPPMWEARFGEGSLALRLAAAFAGGAIMAFGARLAGGCTSGHGISGTLQLSVGSWLAVICFFLGGIPIAMLLFRL